jgi:hypothetical protein
MEYPSSRAKEKTLLIAKASANYGLTTSSYLSPQAIMKDPL